MSDLAVIVEDETHVDETAIPELAVPPFWRALDHILVGGSRVAVAVIGIGFTVSVLTEVASRFLFDTSVAQANSISRFLLVWFL